MHELEQGVGSVKCNNLVIGLMRKALVAQTKAAHARQVNNSDRLFDGLKEDNNLDQMFDGL